MSRWIQPAIDALQHARDLISSGWTRRAYARDSDGRKRLGHEDDAVSWCLIGALRLADEVPFDVASEAIERHCPPLVVPRGLWIGEVFNDQWSSSAEDVLALIDRAIATLQEEMEDESE